MARGRRESGRARPGDRARHSWRCETRACCARRNPRGITEGIRSNVCRHLRARARRGRHRPVRPVVVVWRAGSFAPSRVWHASPHRDDAAADRRDACHRRLDDQRRRPRRRIRTRVADQPRADPRGQSPIVPLGHGAPRAMGSARGRRCGRARPFDGHGARQRSPGDEPSRRTGGQGGLVIAATRARGDA